MSMHSGATALATQPRRAKAVEMMLEGRTDSEIGRELGVDRATVWRWRHDPDVVKELIAADRERREALNERMSALIPRALDVLTEMMNDEAQPALLRVRAAESILDRAAWTGGAQARRVRQEVRAELDSFMRVIAEKAPKGTVDAIVAALKDPWPEADKPARRRPRIVVTAEETDDD